MKFEIEGAAPKLGADFPRRVPSEQDRGTSADVPGGARPNPHDDRCADLGKTVRGGFGNHLVEPPLLMCPQDMSKVIGGYNP